MEVPLFATRVLFAVAAATCLLSTSGCSECTPNDSDPWQSGGVAWTVDGGVTATVGRVHTGGLYEPKTCYESVPMTFSASGERADTGVTTLRGCGDAAPQLGPCVTPSTSGTMVTDAKATYLLDDGSSVLLTGLPPTIQRTDAGGTILYSVPLQYHHVSLPYEITDVRGPATYFVAYRRDVDMTLVVRFDVLNGTVSWEAPLILNNVRQ